MAGGAATPLPSAGNSGIQDILNILGTLGSGTTTTKSGPSDASNAQADELMKAIQDSVNPDNLAKLIQGILVRAKESLGPNIAQTIGSGSRALSDSSLGIIQGNAQAKATAESAQALLEAQMNANRLSTQIVDTKLQSSRTTQSRTGVSPAGKALGGLALINQGVKLKKSLSADEPVKAPEQLGYTPEQLVDLGGPEQLGGPGFDSSSAAVTDVVPASNASSDFSFNDAGDGGFGLIVGTLDNVIDKSQGGGVEIGKSNDGSIIDDGTGLINTDVINTNTGPTTGPTNSGLPGDSSSNDNYGWIICTELHRQKRLPTRYYIYGARTFAKYPEFGKQAYYLWAVPCVKHLRKHPTSLFSWVLEKVFYSRAEYLSAQQGLRGAKKTFLGLLVTFSTYWFCWILGKLISRKVDPIKELENAN